MFSGSQHAQILQVFLGVAALLPAGCDVSRGRAGIAHAAEGSVGRELNRGYSLLYDLLSKESRAEQILIIKLERKPLADLVERISESCQEACEKLEEFAKGDPGMALGERGLPEMEEAARKLIGASTARQLLGSSGLDFEVRFLLTQLSALDYASHLSRALVRNDESAPRREFLQGFSRQCDELSREVYGLLRSKMKG